MILVFRKRWWHSLWQWHYLLDIGTALMFQIKEWSSFLHEMITSWLVTHWSQELFSWKSFKKGNCVLFHQSNNAVIYAINKFFWIHPECMRIFRIRSDYFQLTRFAFIVVTCNFNSILLLILLVFGSNSMSQIVIKPKPIHKPLDHTRLANSSLPKNQKFNPLHFK